MNFRCKHQWISIGCHLIWLCFCDSASFCCFQKIYSKESAPYFIISSVLSGSIIISLKSLSRSSTMVIPSLCQFSDLGCPLFASNSVLTFGYRCHFSGYLKLALLPTKVVFSLCLGLIFTCDCTMLVMLNSNSYVNYIWLHWSIVHISPPKQFDQTSHHLE